MSPESWWWLSLNLATVAFMAYFSMVEMACVSFNKVRLQYYVAKGNQRALWLSWLLSNSSRLFGTTLIGVNVMMMVGSEASRRFYESLGYVPEIAALTQVLVVVTVGELAPIFAARRHPEHVTMLGIPFLYFLSRLLTPVLWLVDGIAKGLTWLLGTTQENPHDIYLSREDLQKVLEEQQEDTNRPSTGTEDFNLIVSHIFSLREKTAGQVMEPIEPLHMLPSNTTVGHMRHIMRNSTLEFLPLYHRKPSNIVGIAHPRDYLRTPDSQSVQASARAPWFITHSTRVVEVLRQFRYNNQSLAIILDRQGKAIGFLTLEAILQEIFGKVEPGPNDPLAPDWERPLKMVERTVRGDLSVNEFCREFSVQIEVQNAQTVSDLVTTVLGHIPDAGEFIVLPPLKLTVKETSLTGARTVTVTSIG